MKLLNIFKFPQDKLKTALVCHLRDKGYSPVVQDGFVYAEGDIPVLLVAHMDTVHKHSPDIICMSDDRAIMMSPFGIGGDDRCGVTMILEVIKELKCSVLFTEDEEIGGVGAEKFCQSEIKPKTNFIIEFDRANENDAVYYELSNDEFMETVESYGFKRAYGTYTDIVSIAPTLGCAAVNLSCGYYNAHTQHEFVSLPQMYAQVERAKKLIVGEQDNFYEYKELPFRRKMGAYDWGGWTDDRWLSPQPPCEQEVEHEFEAVEVSALPWDAYLQSYEDGEIYEVSDADDLLVDEYGTVFEYCPDDLVAYPLYEFVAINASGMLCKLDPKNSFQVDVEW